MATKKDKIGESLGIDPSTPPPNPVKINNLVPALKAGENNDYEYARRNMYDIIEKGTVALEDMMDIAKQSESARAFEVVTNLIKTLAETNKDLLELAKKDKEIKKEDVVPEHTTVNNNLHITSADLLKMLKDKNSD